jgi:hypothetical protein
MWEGSSDTCSAFCVKQEKMYNDVLDDVAFKVRYGGERREGTGRVGLVAIIKDHVTRFSKSLKACASKISAQCMINHFQNCIANKNVIGDMWAKYLRFLYRYSGLDICIVPL